MTYTELANVFLYNSDMYCPNLSYVSGGVWGFSYYRKMLYSPWETKQTLGDVTSMTSHFLKSFGKSLDYYYPRPCMTSNWVYIDFDVPGTNHGRLSRFSTIDYTEQIYDPTSLTDPQRVYWFFIPDSDNVFYTLENVFDDLVTYDNMEISRVELDDLGNIVSKTKLFEWDNNYPVVDGNEYVLWDSYYFGRVKYGSDDCIVNIWSYINDGPGDTPPYLLKVVIYHLDSNTASEQWITPSDDMDADIYNMYGNSSSPSFYQSKLIFTGSVEPPSGMPGPPYGSHALFITYIIDVSDDSVTKVDNVLFNLDENWAYAVTYSITSTIDYNTGTYYFIVYIEPEDNIGSGFCLYSMDIENPSMELVENFGLTGDKEAWQGEIDNYLVDKTPAPGSCSVRETPTRNVITTVDVYVEHGADYFESACAIDIPENMIWNIRANTLQGKTLGGGADRDISVAWSGDTVPFAYPAYANKELWIRILNEMCLVMVYSRSATYPYTYQTDFYLLKETE
jgi:hypothetical protein